jgi:transcriptional regulator with XRE-family HTH domain
MPAQTTASLGELIRRRRRNYNGRALSQVEVGELLGVHQSTVAKYERGDKIGVEKLVRVADFLGMDFTEVLAIYHGTAEASTADDALVAQVEDLRSVVETLSATVSHLMQRLDAQHSEAEPAAAPRGRRPAKPGARPTS